MNHASLSPEDAFRSQRRIGGLVMGTTLRRTLAAAIAGKARPSAIAPARWELLQSGASGVLYWPEAAALMEELPEAFEILRDALRRGAEE